MHTQPSRPLSTTVLVMSLGFATLAACGGPAGPTDDLDASQAMDATQTMDVSLPDAHVCVPTGQETCNGSDDDCDTRTDEGELCDDGLSCTAAGCACTGELCDGVCINVGTDVLNCGDCGTVCPSHQGCGTEGCCDAARDTIDLLFVVDNSYRMEESQLRLAYAIPRFVAQLTSGDLDQDGTQDAVGIDLQIGVVTADMGTGTFSVPSCSQGALGDDAVLRTAGLGSASCSATYPRVHTVTGGVGAAAAANAVSCVILGSGVGCGFQQTLESALKATTVSTSPIRFVSNTTGHADGPNVGFLRDDALLVVIVLTDADDCSVADPELLNPNSATYGDASTLGLRCHNHPSALHSTSRLVDALIASKPSPGRVVFGAIAGIPVDLEGASFSAMLADDRMVARIDDSGDALVPSCAVSAQANAYPPRRLVGAAAAVESLGGHAAIASICQESFTGFFDSLVARLGPVFRRSCE